jgi:hypothetical protein
MAETPSLQRSSTRGEFLAAVALLALALRLGFMFGFQIWETSFAAEDLTIAHYIAEGRGFSAPALHGDYVGPTSQKAPAVPYMLAFGLWLGTFPFFWYQIVQALAGAACCWWIGRLGERVLYPRAAMLSAVLLAVYVPLIWWMKYAGDHIFGGAALLVCLLLLYRAADTGTLVAAAQWGAALGVSAYFSAEPLVAAPFFALWLAWRRRSDGWVIALTAPALAAAVALLVISPWTLRNYAVHGELVLVRTGFGTALWWGNNKDATGTDWFLVTDENGETRRVSGRYRMPEELASEIRDLPEVEQERHLARAGFAWIRANPGKAARLFARKFGLYWWFNYIENVDSVPILREIFWAGVLAFFLVGAGSALATRAMIAAPVLLPLATSSLLHSLTVVSHNWRMRLPVEPLMLLFAAHGLLVVLGRFSPRFAPSPITSTERAQS